MRLPDRPGTDDPLAEEVHTFADRWSLSDRAAELDRREEFPSREFRAMGEAGLLGLHTSTRLGGRGLPLARTGVGLFHLGYRGGTAFAKLSLQPEFSSVVAEHGSEELIDQYFRPLVKGRLLLGNQVTEPRAGSDAGAIVLEARFEGDQYVLTGVKSEAAFATEADAAIVYGVVSPTGNEHGGVTAFLVPQDHPGIRRQHVSDLGERWMRRGRVEYDHVRVPAACRIGKEGEGFDYLKVELTRERALLGAVYLGVARASWEETVAHVGDRIAFGRRLADQQSVGFPLVEDWARLDAAWEYVSRTLARLDSGEDAAGEAALAKWLATEVSLTTIDHAIQFHGGQGYSSALPHERRWRDVRSGAIAHGPSEVMHLVAARRLWPRSHREVAGAQRGSTAPAE